MNDARRCGDKTKEYVVTACGCYDNNVQTCVWAVSAATRTAAKPTQNTPKPQNRPSPKAEGSTKAAPTATKQQSWKQKEGHKGTSQTKARSNKKRRGERVDHILNSM